MMSDFDKWFKSLNENGRVTYFLGQESKIAEEAWFASAFTSIDHIHLLQHEKENQQSEIDQLKAEVEKLKNPSLVLHTKKYKEQCEAFESLSDAEKKAYSIGYEWACKVSQQQILTLIQDHESIEDRSDKKIEKLKAENEKLELELSQAKQVLHNVIDIERSKVEKLKAEKVGLEKTIQDALEVITSKISNCRISEERRNLTIGQQNTAFSIREELQVVGEALRGGYE